jgi:hypothetical protein
MPDNTNFDILTPQFVRGGALDQAPNGVNPELRKVYLQFAVNASGNDQSGNTAFSRLVRYKIE